MTLLGLPEGQAVRECQYQQRKGEAECNPAARAQPPADRSLRSDPSRLPRQSRKCASFCGDRRTHKPALPVLLAQRLAHGTIDEIVTGPPDRANIFQ
jgi:hypothetical protein